MEIIVRIQEQLPLQEREYTNKDGMQEKFASLPFLLQHGDCTFYAEMIQEQARKTGTCLFPEKRPPFRVEGLLGVFLVSPQFFCGRCGIPHFRISAFENKGVKIYLYI